MPIHFMAPSQIYPLVTRLLNEGLSACGWPKDRTPSTGLRYQHYAIFERGYIRSSPRYLADFVISGGYYNLWLTTPNFRSSKYQRLSIRI